METEFRTIEIKSFEMIMKHLIDIEVTDFDQTLEGTPSLKSLRMMVRMIFHFSENPYYSAIFFKHFLSESVQ